MEIIVVLDIKENFVEQNFVFTTSQVPQAESKFKELVRSLNAENDVETDEEGLEEDLYDCFYELNNRSITLMWFSMPVEK